MSTIETHVVFLAEMAEGVTDIKEQFNLDLSTTKAIAAKYGIRHPISPDKKSEVMTIDLWVEFQDRAPLAISVKEVTALANKRTLAKLQME
ncbi:MAG: TnsA endonuclease N-terminal domain-containing protein, partial [Methylophilaceae bacterium]